MKQDYFIHGESDEARWARWDREDQEEREAWKRGDRERYGIGGSNSIWSVGFILTLVWVCLISIGIGLAIADSMIRRLK